MIDFIKYANISLIYTKDLFFYDPSKISECVAFCKLRGITFLPDKDRKRYWRLQEDTFEMININQSKAICSPTDPIFSISTLKKFEDNDSDNVLLVTDQSKAIVGVVHIVDYNNDVVYFELYKLIYQFEKMLRDYLISKGQSNESFKHFVSQQRINETLSDKDRKHWSARHDEYFGKSFTEITEYNRKKEVLGPFQLFYLSDLLSFFNYVGQANGISIRQNELESIKSIRNRIAHGHDIINSNLSDSNSNSGRLYDFKGLLSFVSHANLFFKSYDKMKDLRDQTLSVKAEI